MGFKKKLIPILCAIFLLTCSFPVFAFDGQFNGNQINPPVEPVVGVGNSSLTSPSDSFVEKVTDVIQEIRFEVSPVDDREVSSLHIRPAWQWNRLEAQLDFGFYLNPWSESWQWGQPDPAVHPQIPNFIESVTYYGKNYELNYQTITDLNYGYGLILYDYHPDTPYRSIQFTAKPWPDAQIILTEPAEFHYLAPFTPDLTASLETIRFESRFTVLNLPWGVGITGIREENNDLKTAGYPEKAWGIDLALTKNAGLVPFVESAQLVDKGNGWLAGLAGKYAFVTYQAGYFRTNGRFLPNYFGGRYEDQKQNTLDNLPDALPDLGSGLFSARDGWLGRLSLEVGGFINFGLFYLDDTNADRRMFGVNLSGELVPLHLKYGFSNYGQSGALARYDWYVKGSWGIWDYGFHHYYREAASQEAFLVGVRL